MKKLMLIIPVLILVLILSFTPACESTVPLAPEELLQACKQGNIEEVERLLEQGADANSKEDDTGWSALILAVFMNHTEIAELLIDSGADVNAKDDLGRTALSWAEQYGHTDFVDLLKEKGAIE